mgnify:CR=1 FL=1
MKKTDKELTFMQITLFLIHTNKSLQLWLGFISCMNLVILELAKRYFDCICSEYDDELSCGKILEKTKYRVKQNNTCVKTKLWFF